MTQLFDGYDQRYGEVVQSSIDFSGLPHRFFMAAKADLIRDFVVGKFGADQKPTALDVGCGVGTLHPLIRAGFDRLCGLDVSPSCIAQAQAANPGIEYRSYDGVTIPYLDAAFDLTFAVCVMHHVSPVRWLSFLGEMRRVTRPGGGVCVIEHNPFNPLTRLSVARCEFDRDAKLLSAWRTERLMLRAGLHGIDTRHFLLLPSASVRARRIERRFARWPLGAQYMTCAAP